MRLLANTKVTLRTENSIDNITISKDFEDVKFNENQEYEVEFQVPNNLSSISISVTTQVLNASRGDKSNFSASHTFNINNHSHDYEFCETYLRNYQGNYQFFVKGKNGEPKKGVVVDFTFKNKYYYEATFAALKTDVNGMIVLGKLRNITQVIAKPRSSRIINQNQKSWTLPENYHLSYPSVLDILTTETLRFPFKHSSVKATNLSFVQVNAANSAFIKNCFN